MNLRLERIAGIFLLTILLQGLSILADKLNERRILLPYNSGVASNFTLEALSSTSCYKWSSSRPEIVSIQVIGDPACSTKAVVTVTSQVPKRQNSVVTARDVKTNLQIRCDVEVDVISRIAITTTTREIVLGELPEMIKVLAYNEKDDVFTSIGGIQMDWLVQPSDILRYRFWSSSSYAAPDFVTYWEQLGSKSSFVLLEGIQTGTALVEARVLDPSYASKVVPSSVNFNVVANLILSPSNDLFIVRGTKVTFKAEIAKQASKSILKLPMVQYFVEVLDNNVAQFQEDSMVLTALEEGQTSLLLRDRNLNGESLSKTSTEIHVMSPSYIAIHLGTENSPFLKNGFIYEVTLTLHDSFHHNLFISDNLRLSAIFPEEFFEVLEKSINGTYYVVRTKMTGNCQVKGQFFGTEDLPVDEDDALTVYQDVAIYNALEISPAKLYLPFIENSKANYTLEFSAKGATGEYVWEMQNDVKGAGLSFSRDHSSVATLYHRGNRGRVSLFCMDPLASSTFNALAEVHIEPVEGIEILSSAYEAEIGASIDIPIALHGTAEGQKISFDSCHQLEFQIDIVEKEIVAFNPENNASPTKPACRSFSFQCLTHGNTRIWLNLAGIQTSFMIGCHRPLQVLHPTEPAYLTLGSSINVAFQGGPRPWSLSPEGHFRSTDTTENIFTLQEIKNRYRFNKDLYVFRVTCSEYGESNFQLTIGNSASDKLPVPSISSASVKIFCAKPAAMSLRPKLKATCPISKSAFPVERDQDAQIEVTVLDEKNKVFYNFSTMSFKWIKTGDGYFDETLDLEEDVDDQQGYEVLRRAYKVLKNIHEKSHVIKAKSFGYRNLNLRDSFQLEAQVEISLTDVPYSVEDPITILKQSDNKKYLQIFGGSGHFTAEEGYNRDNLQIEMDSNQKHLMITPKRVSSDSLNIVDLCLEYPPLSLSYFVVVAGQIQVTIIDKIELGQEVVGTFVVLDNRGQEIDSSLHSFFKFSVEAWKFLEVSAIRPHDNYSSSFRVKALEVGNTKLMIKSNLDTLQPMKSAQSQIQVFPPLSIYPSNITLILGNRFQVSLIGGPETSRNLRFSIKDDSIAIVEQNGLITARALGRTTLNVAILSVNNFVYSHSKVEVFVIPLTKIKIFSPVNHILVGSNVPLHLLGANFEHETPMMFGHALPPLKIDWSISNENVAVLESSFQHMGVVDRSLDRFSTRFVARSPGTVQISVRVEANSRGQIGGGLTILEDSVQLDVYPKFSPIFAGSNHHSESNSKALLLSPNSQLKLHFDPTDDVTYRVLNGSQVNLINDTSMSLIAGDLPEYAQLVVYRNVHKSGVHEYYNFAIHVDKVHFLDLEFVNLKPSSGHFIDAFPVGSELEFQVVFFDNHGRRFDAVRSGLNAHLSNSDVVAIIRGQTDDAFVIRSVGEGTVILHIYDDVNAIGTFYKIHVGSILEPIGVEAIESLEVGDVVCFRSKLKISENEASWSLLSDDGNVPGSLSENGVFVALRSGKASLIYRTEVDGFRTQNSLVVNRLGRITFDGPVPKAITTTSSLMIPIKITGKGGDNFKRSLKNTCTGNEALMHVDNIIDELTAQRSLPFVCSVQFKNTALTSLWSSRVIFNFAQNQWACFFTARDDLDINTLEILSTNMLEVSVTVMANGANLDEREFFESDSVDIHSIDLPFLPPFQASTKRIVFTPEKAQNLFLINSAPSVLQEMQISSSNFDLIEVEKVEAINNTLKVLAILKNANIFSDDVSNLHLLLRSELTNQTERIPIQIRLVGTLEELRSQFYPYLIQLGTICTTIFGLAVIAFFFYRKSPERPPASNCGLFDTPDSSRRISNIPKLSPNTPDNSFRIGGSNTTPRSVFSPQSSTPRSPTTPGRRLYSYTPLNE